MGFKSCTSSPDLFSGFLAAPPRNEVLETIGTLVDWPALRSKMAAAYTSGVGCEGYDPVQLFKLLVLERLYNLSDVAVVEEAADRLSFRAFVGFEASDRVPDDTTLVRFRKRLREANLFDELFATITAQMEAQGLGVREGSIKIVDATLVPAAVHAPRKPKDGAGATEPPLDPDAEVSSKNGKYHYGYKLHHATDRETGLVTDHVLTGGATHDSQVFEELLDGSEAEVLADKGYDAKRLRAHLSKHKTRASIMKRACKNKPLTKWQTTRNRSIGRVRQFIEGTNAALKRWRGCARAIYRGTERVWIQMTLGVLAHNLMRYSALHRARCAQ